MGSMDLIDMDLIDDDDARNYKWHISPHPYSKDFDVYVTNDDESALEAATLAIEQGWDETEPGNEFTVTVRHHRIGDPLP